MKKAKSALTSHKIEIRKSEIAWLCFNTGVLVAEFVFYLVKIITSGSFGISYEDTRSNPARFFAYRFFTTFNVLGYLAGIAILIFKHFKINYPYIFEISA